MKKLSRFQKQLIAAAVVLAVALALFAVYMFNKPEEEAEVQKAPTLNYGFNTEEEAALNAFNGSAVFTFSAEKGKADEKTAAIMNLAADYAAMNSGISLVFGNGDELCTVKLNGKVTATVKDGEVECYYNEEEKLYAVSGIRYAFNMAVFGDSLGISQEEKMALPGFDTKGNTLNKGGNIVLFSLGNEYGELAFVELSNKQSKEVVFYVDEDTGLPAIIGAEGMDVNQASAVFLMSFAQNPVAIATVDNPGDLSEYGLDSDENAEATILVAVSETEFRRIRIGKAAPGGNGYYALCDDKNNDYRDIVYILDATSSYALFSMEQFLTASYGIALDDNNELFTAIDDMTITINGEEMKFEKLTKEESALYSISYFWKVTEPERFVDKEKGYALSGFYNVSDVFFALSTLQSSDIKVALPTEEDLAEYGLDNPYRSYSWVVYDNIRCTVHMTEPDDNGKFYAYGYRDVLGKNGYRENLGIGSVSVSSFSNPDGVCYATYEAINFIHSQLFTDYIDALDSMTFIRNGETHVFKFKKEDGKITSVTLDGKKTDLQSVRHLYVSSIDPIITGEYAGDVEAGKDVTVIFDCDGVKTEMSYTRLNSVEVYVLLNGTGKYTVNYKHLAPIIENLETILGGGTISR